MSWSESDNFFVSADLEVFSIDLKISSAQLQLTRSTDVVYDGPEGDDFKSFLFSRDFRVNRQGKTIVRVPKRNVNGEYNLEDFDFLLLETVVPLDTFGFSNVPLPKPQEVNELQRLLDDTKAELAKKNDVLNELLQKKSKRWNWGQFRITITSITMAMKRILIFFGLEPLGSLILSFFLMVRDLILNKEFGSTFLGTTNEILISIATIFHQRTGLTIGIETSPGTPVDLIKNLNILRDFMESHLFIDASVIVKAFGLMNMDDLPAIFHDSATGVAQLKHKEIGAKSIDNIDGKSILYGYFNIPMVGMFKGILTRVHVTLPDEIMVKLQVIGKHTLINEDKGFWFVYANGEGIFEKSLSAPEESNTNIINASNNLSIKLEDVKFTPSRVLGGRADFLGFLQRMNRIFVNEMGTYVKFEFIATKFSGPRLFFDDILRYYNKDWHTCNPLSMVQFDTNESGIDIDLQREVSIPEAAIYPDVKYGYPSSWIVNQARGNICAFTFREFCFIGRITGSSGNFRNNALVSVFFEQHDHAGAGQNGCYVDALATTFFVVKTEPAHWWTNHNKKAPEFIDGRGFPTS